MREFGVTGSTSPDGPFSAPERLLARWSANDGLPEEVAGAFAIAGRSELEPLEPRMAYLDVEAGDPGVGFEPIPMLAVADAADGPLAICVWPETGEGFGPMAREWLAEDPEARESHFTELMALIGVEDRQLGLDLAIGLMRRFAQALLVARDNGMAQSVVLIHDFDPDSGWFDEFELIGQTIGVDPPRNRVVNFGARAGVRLYGAWVDAPRSA